MAQYYIQEETLRQLGDAIREKTGSSEQMTPGQMVNAILEMEGAKVWEGTLNTNQNGVLTLPDIGFEPKTVIASNIEPAYLFDDGSTAYTGFIAMAIYDEQFGKWFELIPSDYSFSVLADNSYEPKDCFYKDETSGCYIFDVSARRYNSLNEEDLSELAFKIRIFG